MAGIYDVDQKGGAKVSSGKHRHKRLQGSAASATVKGNQRKSLRRQVIASGDDEEHTLVEDAQDSIELFGPSREDVSTLSPSLTRSQCLNPWQPVLSKDVSTFLMKLNRKNGVKSDSDDSPKRKLDRPKIIVKKSRPKTEEQQLSNPAAIVTPPRKVALNSKTHFIIQPTAQWYTSKPQLAPHASLAPASPEKLAAFASRAASLHDADTATFQHSSAYHSSSSEASFLQKMSYSGTLSDRLSALTLLVQNSPLHNVKALETLKGMAEKGRGKGGRGDCLKALRCVVDWWVGGGAPPSKLKSVHLYIC